MELLIVFNILLILFLVGTYLSLTGRVRKLEEVMKRKTSGTDVTPGGRLSVDAQVKIPAAQEGAASPAGQKYEEVTKESKAWTSEETVAEEQAVSGEPVPHRTPGRVAGMLRPRTREEWEILFGGKLANRVGALALFLAVGFFLKYAFDNDWLNETARVILGGAAGLLLIAGGHRFNRRELPVFAQGLTGAGVAILYLSIYAAFDFYHLVPQPVAFVLMALVTAAALLLSLYYDARAIALLGWTGGFLTPLLLVTTDLNTLGLFVYLTLIDAGLIAILVRRRRWRLIELLAIAATYAIYLTWSFRANLPDGLGSALVFLTLWWAMFVGMDLCRSFTEKLGNRWWRWAVVSINAIGYYVMLMRLSRHTEGIWSFLGFQFVYQQSASVYFDGVVSAVLSLAYFTLAVWILRRADDPSAASIYGTGAVLLAVRAPMSFFTRYGLIITWALEAFALFGAGIHFGRRAVRHAGTAVLALSFVGIFLFGGAYVINLVSSYVPVLTLRTAAYWVVGGSLLACAGMLQSRIESQAGTDPKRDRLLCTVFHLAWSFLLLVWGTVEVLNYYQYRIVTLDGVSTGQLENMRQLAISGVWLSGAALVMFLGRVLDIRALRAAAIVYFGCTVVKAFVFDLMMLDTLYRIFAFLGLSAILIAVSYLYYRRRPAS